MKHLQKGFTLIELMIVIAIIGILASVAIPAYTSYIQTSNESACLAETRSYVGKLLIDLNSGTNISLPIFSACTSIEISDAGTTANTSIAITAGSNITPNGNINSNSKIWGKPKSPGILLASCDLANGQNCKLVVP